MNWKKARYNISLLLQEDNLTPMAKLYIAHGCKNNEGTITTWLMGQIS